MDIDGLRVRIEPVRYCGYMQGHKVKINGVKYPRKHGHFYTCFDPIKALNVALVERKTANS